LEQEEERERVSSSIANTKKAKLNEKRNEKNQQGSAIKDRRESFARGNSRKTTRSPPFPAR
jgi:hypothetical protein